MHHPDYAAEVAQARELGGKHRRRDAVLSVAYDLEDLRTVEGNRRLLEIVAFETLALPNSIARDRTLLAVVSTNTKVIETAELEARIAALEFAIGRDRESRLLDESDFPQVEP